MRFGVLGPLAVWTADGSPVTVPGIKVRTLLAVLLAHAPHPISTDRLLAELWGTELPGNPMGALQAKVSQLRRVLSEVEPAARHLVESRAPGYRLQVEHGVTGDTDAGYFARLLATARDCTEPREQVTWLGEALALWRGEAYADIADSPVARAAATRLEEQRITAVEDLAEARLALGEHSPLAAELEEVVVQHPLRERLRAAHLRALYLAGRQSEALDQFAQLRTQLRDQLGADPSPQLTQLHQAILVQDPGLQPPSPTGATQALSTNLPTAGTHEPELVGRAEALAAVREQLDTARLLTLTGPGGVGKTRLAVEVAQQLRPDFAGGVWLVELASQHCCTDTMDSVAGAITAALDIRENTEPRRPDGAEQPDIVTRLTAAVDRGQLLLVLDNCEHVLAAVGELSERLLAAAPELCILTTSREPLGTVGEHTYVVDPLTPPTHTGQSVGPAELSHSSAVRLFVDRVVARNPDFQLTTENATAVASVCQRLDGLPLALELAATRVRALGVHELAERLDDRFQLLTSGRRTAPERQRTLQAVIDWSWELLSTEEQAILRRLAVFADGSSLAAVEAVCSDTELAATQVVDLVARLVDRSLVHVQWHGQQARYRLLESVATYCMDRLVEAGEAAALRQKHAEYYMRLAEDVLPRACGHAQQDWLRECDRESANYRVAITAASQLDAGQLALRLVNATSWYRLLRGRHQEMRHTLTLAIAAADSGTGGEVNARGYARSQVWRACIAYLDGQDSDPDALRRAALDHYTTLTDSGDRAYAQWLLALSMLGSGNTAVSRPLVESALVVFREQGDRWGIAATLGTRAELALVAGDMVGVRRDSAESRSLFQELGDRWGQLHPTQILGQLAEIDGDYATAERNHRTALRMAEAMGKWPSVADQLAHLGRLALLSGDLDSTRDYHHRALELAEQQAYAAGAAFAANGLAFAERREGKLDAAEVRLRRLLDWNTRVGYQPGIALMLAELGFIAELRGHARTAWELHDQGLRNARATGDPRAMALAMEGLAGAAASAGEAIRAARLLGAAAAARESVGAPLPPAERGDVERIERAVQARLGAHIAAVEQQRGAHCRDYISGTTKNVQ